MNGSPRLSSPEELIKIVIFNLGCNVLEREKKLSSFSYLDTYFRSIFCVVSIYDNKNKVTLTRSPVGVGELWAEMCHEMSNA